MIRGLLYYAALRVRQPVYDRERVWIDAPCDFPDAVNFKPRHHAQQDLLFGAAATASAFVDRDSSIQILNYRLSDLFAQIGDDDDGVVLFDAVNDEIHRL